MLEALHNNGKKIIDTNNWVLLGCRILYTAALVSDSNVSHKTGDRTGVGIWESACFEGWKSDHFEITALWFLSDHNYSLLTGFQAEFLHIRTLCR